MNKIPQEAVEFQPDALALKNEKLPPWLRYSAWYSLVFLLFVILWAVFCKVDVIVRANGKLVSDSPNIVMKPLERTVIKDINVKIGQIVKKDQILITFDPVIGAAEIKRLEYELTALNAQITRLQAEFTEKAIDVSSVNNFQKIQTIIFGQKKEYYREKLRYYDESISQLDASRRTKEENLSKQRERLAAVKKIEDMFVILRDKQATSQKELLQISISRMEMEASVDSVENSLVEISHQRETLLAAKNSFIQEWRNSIAEELIKTERERSATLKEYEKAKNLVSYLYLRAPCDAVVHEITSFSKGSAVREAEPLVTLIPLNEKIELEAEVSPLDIGKINIGSEARIKLNSYPFQKYGTLDGEIRIISEDTIRKEQYAQTTAAEGGQVYYRTRITVSGKLRNVKSNFRLIPGMEAQAEIKTGRRRIIEFILYPIIKGLDEAIREP